MVFYSNGYSEKIKKISEKCDIKISDKYIIENIEKLREINDVFIPLIVEERFGIKPIDGILSLIQLYDLEYVIGNGGGREYWHGFFGDPDNIITRNRVWLYFIDKYPEHKNIIKIICKETNKEIDYFKI